MQFIDVALAIEALVIFIFHLELTTGEAFRSICTLDKATLV